MTASTPEELPRLGRYQVLNKLAQGGMAEIFLAKALGVMGFERLVAIKLIHSQLTRDPEFVKMFIDEARIAMHLQHRNIVQVFDLDRTGENYFIAMEYVHGCNLYDVYERIAARGRWIDLPLALYIVAEVCKGLHFAHTRKGPDGRPLGIIHRDISPQNVLLSMEGEVKITDFGIAKAAERLHVTTPGIVKGKYAYMAPEILKEKPVDGRADVFACGVLLYELLVGENPYAGATPVQTIENVLNKRVPAPSQRGALVSSELDQITLTALAKDANDRFRSAAELAEALTEHGLNLTTARRDMASGDSTVAAMLTELFPEKAKRSAGVAAPGGVQLPLVSSPEISRDTAPEERLSGVAEPGMGKTDPEGTDEADSTLLNLGNERPAIDRREMYRADDEPSTALDLDPIRDVGVPDKTDPVKMDYEMATDRSLPSIADDPPPPGEPRVVDGSDPTFFNPGRRHGPSAFTADERRPLVSPPVPAGVPDLPLPVRSEPLVVPARSAQLEGVLSNPSAGSIQPESSRALLWLGVVLMLVAALAVVGVAVIRRGPPMVAVPITTTPTGATVMINGERQENPAPLEAMLPVGQTHRIEVTLPGYKAARRDLLTLEGIAAQIDFILEPLTGALIFEVEPKDAVLFVNGQRRGTVPPRLDVTLGQDVVIRIERDGYKPNQQSLALSEAQPEITLRVKLEPAEPPRKPR